MIPRSVRTPQSKSVATTITADGSAAAAVCSDGGAIFGGETAAPESLVSGSAAWSVASAMAFLRRAASHLRWVRFFENRGRQHIGGFKHLGRDLRREGVLGRLLPRAGIHPHQTLLGRELVPHIVDL